jgi:hypothetical protein
VILDRAYQLELLQLLATSYPLPYADINDVLQSLDEEAGKRRYNANMLYLEEHGLVESGIQFGADHHVHYSLPRINNRGLDFLLDDGGISAILKTITVRVDSAQWAEILARNVEESTTLTEEKRSAVAKAIRALPATALEKLTSKMLEWAVEHAGDALPYIADVLGKLGS